MATRIQQLVVAGQLTSTLTPIKYHNCCSNDAWNMDISTLFKHFSDDIDFHTTLGKEQVLQVFDKIKFYHSKYDRFVCCALSFSGKEHKLYGSDNVPFSIDSIVADLKTDSCKTHKGN